jgi:hypothetical protein
MKLNKDPFLANMNMVELDGKKVLVQPSQVESPKGKDLIIGEEHPPRMIKLKSSKDGQWRRASHSDAQRPPSTSSWPSIRKARLTSGIVKTRPFGIPNRTVQFPWVRPAPLQPEPRLANDLRLHRGKIQKAEIVVNKIIIWCLTSQSGHQSLGCGDLRR